MDEQTLDGFIYRSNGQWRHGLVHLPITANCGRAAIGYGQRMGGRQTANLLVRRLLTCMDLPGKQQLGKVKIVDLSKFWIERQQQLAPGGKCYICLGDAVVEARYAKLVMARNKRCSAGFQTPKDQSPIRCSVQPSPQCR